MTPRVALITGGLTGIGLASAKALASAGHSVAICSRRGDEDEFAASALAALNGACLIGAVDVASQTSINAFVTEVTQQFGPPQILVNAAGNYREAFLSDPDDAAWFDQIDINLNGCYRTIRATFAGMQALGWGRIVNIASTAGTKGAAGYSGYCAAKAGVIGLSKAVAVEGAPYGINAISISPTWVETPMMDNALLRHAAATGGNISAAKAALMRSNPQGRLVQPGEIGSVVGFFCSDQSQGLTNVDIQINAGADW